MAGLWRAPASVLSGHEIEQNSSDTGYHHASVYFCQSVFCVLPWFCNCEQCSPVTMCQGTGVLFFVSVCNQIHMWRGNERIASQHSFSVNFPLLTSLLMNTNNPGLGNGSFRNLKIQSSVSCIVSNIGLYRVTHCQVHNALGGLMQLKVSLFWDIIHFPTIVFQHSNAKIRENL